MKSTSPEPQASRPAPAPQLDLFTAAIGDPNVAWLEKLLREHGRWLTASDLLRWCGREESEDGKRLFRSLANASGWIISGQKGYKHIEHSSPEEIAHASNWMISQGKTMIKRGILIRKNAHKRIGK